MKERVRKNRNDLVFYVSFVAGDIAVETDQGLHLVYMHAGVNAYEVIDQAVK